MAAIKDLTTKLFQSNIVKNVGWLIFDKILRLSLSLIVVIWLARYLGPEQFGTLNYALALVSIVGTVAALGLNGLVVRDLVRQPEQAPLILGSAFALKVIAAVTGYLLVVAVVYLLDIDDIAAKLCLVLGFIFIFKSTDVFKYWFESQVRSKYVVIAENGVFFIIALSKLLLIYFQAPLIAFAWAYIGEVAGVALWLTLIYRRQHPQIKWAFNAEKASALLKECWPLIISVAAWILYTRIDQLMIGQLIDKEAVGYFSAAVRISEVTNMLPAILVMSLMPGIIRLQHSQAEHYKQRMQFTYDICVWLMLFVAIIVQFSADFAIAFLFTSSFSPAANVLKLQIWCGIFLAFALISSRYLINEGKQSMLMRRNLLGLALNVPLNYLLIPQMGIEGAALASLISVICVSYLFDLANSFLRPVFWQKTRALLLISSWRAVALFITRRTRKQHD